MEFSRFSSIKQRSLSKADKKAIAKEMEQTRIEMLVETMISVGVDEVADSNQALAGLLLEAMETVENPEMAAKYETMGREFFAELLKEEDEEQGPVLGLVDKDGQIKPRR